MTKFDTDARELATEELEAVAGGVMEGGCIRLPNVLRLPTLPLPEPFKDIFAKHTIG